jgi:hypothetical protein
VTGSTNATKNSVSHPAGLFHHGANQPTLSTGRSHNPPTSCSGKFATVHTALILTLYRSDSLDSAGRPGILGLIAWSRAGIGFGVLLSLKGTRRMAKQNRAVALMVFSLAAWGAATASGASWSRQRASGRGAFGERSRLKFPKPLDHVRSVPQLRAQSSVALSEDLLSLSDSG